MKPLGISAVRYIATVIVLAAVLITVPIGPANYDVGHTTLATEARVPATESMAKLKPAPTLPISNKEDRARANHIYSKLPLSFEANEGQTDSSVKFISRAGNQTLFLTSTEAVLSVHSAARTSRGETSLSINPSEDRRSEGDSASSVLRMKLVGANPAAKVAGLDELPGKSNYFIGNDPKKWRTNVANYARVKYEQVYPGVDLVYYGNQNQLEYDLIVAPGADPQVIALKFGESHECRVDATGDLVLRDGAVEIRQHTPIVYQEISGFRREVASRYVRNADNLIRIEVASYDHDQPLIIDPVLVYSSYLGGGDSDSGLAIAVDSAGSAYITGPTRSLNFPTTPGAFQTVAGPFAGVFLTKINAAGSAIVYSTYLGFGESHGIAVDSSGNAYVVGDSGASDFPTTPGAFDRTYNGSGDTFVTKVDSSGSSLVYSTYVGGTSGEFGRAIAVDSAGQAYVTGLTTSADYPLTPGAFQSELRGGRSRGGCVWGDAYVSKLNISGSGLVYSTLLGGDLAEGGSGIAVDAGGNAYVTGATSSANFPTSAGAFQTSHTPCSNFICEACVCEDAFLTKLNAQGSDISYSTFLGGSVCDNGVGIAIDPVGNAYVVGTTNSSNFPLKNPIQNSFGGFRDVFVSKINSAGSALIYSTYFGGADDDEGTGVAADSAGSAYIVGVTDLSFSVPFRNGTAFAAKLESTGASFTYFLKLGDISQSGSFGNGITVDKTGDVYVTGSAGATGFPITSRPFQLTFGGGSSDAFVAKISDPPPFDVCLQDDSNGNFLLANTTTGDYQFTSCRGGAVLSGKAVITKKGCLISLQVSGPDRRFLARIDTCLKTGTASMQVLSQGTTFTTLDRNITNNTCKCSG